MSNRYIVVYLLVAYTSAFSDGTPSTYAKSSYVGRIPNGAVNGCATCHPTVPSVNSFGTAFSQAGKTWSATLAARDSDGDQFTNGQELGDPKGTGTPIAGAKVTNPGASSSHPVLEPPVIGIASPTNGTVATAPFTGQILAALPANAATLSQIQFYLGTNLLGTVSAAPYAWPLSLLVAGQYPLTIQATDYLGAIGVSPVVILTLQNPPAPLTITGITKTGNQAVIAWTGGRAPFAVQMAASLDTTNWFELLATNGSPVSVTLNGPAAFFRVLGSTQAP